MAIHFYIDWHEVLSNFSALMVEVDGVLYPTSEHAYQAAKCTDAKGKEVIRAAQSPLLAKKVARETYQWAKHPDWDNNKVKIMESILRAKLAQHDEVREALLRTGTEEIIEASPADTFWGNGKDGTGQNQLGKLWMKIRSEL